MINYCWLLLTPDTLNRLKVVLHEEHGYSFEEADEYIEEKQTNVLNDLRLMAISGKLTPLGCNVINLLMKRKSECSHTLNNTKDKNARTALKFPCRTIIKCSKSNIAIITSCREPRLQVVKDKSTDITPDILKVKNTQTTPEPEKQVRSQLVQTELKGKHTSVQTELVHDDPPIDDAILNIINTSLDNFFTEKATPATKPEKQNQNTSLDNFFSEKETPVKKPEKQNENTSLDNFFSEKETPVKKPEKQDESVSFLRDLMNIESSTTSSETLQEQPQETKAELNQIIEEPLISPAIDTMTQHITYDRCIHTTSCEEDTFMSASSQQYFSQSSSLNDTVDTTFTEALADGEYFEGKGTPQISPSSHKNQNLDTKDQPILLRREKTEDPRASIFITKRQSSSLFDEAVSLNYHTPSRDESHSDHVRFNFDFNADELASRIFELHDDIDDNITFFTQSDTSSHNSQYNDALDRSRDDSQYNDALDRSRDDSQYNDALDRSRDDSQYNDALDRSRDDCEYNDALDRSRDECEYNDALDKLYDDSQQYNDALNKLRENSQYNDTLDKSRDEFCFTDKAFQSADQCNDQSTTTQRQSTSFYMNRNMEMSEIPHNVTKPIHSRSND
ncbi:hypothetical protein WDU94_014223 [Cyamophila willieti]